MSQIMKKDLFAPIVIKKKRSSKPYPKHSAIPHTSDWKRKHGSWAVMNGIVKVESNNN
jgi:hypothetical protein